MRAVIATGDLLARSRLEAAAGAAGYEVDPARRVPPPGDPAPDVLVVDLDSPGAIEALEAWRPAHPDERVVAFCFHVEADLVARAKALGVRVLPRGATADSSTFFS